MKKRKGGRGGLGGEGRGLVGFFRHQNQAAKGDLAQGEAREVMRLGRKSEASKHFVRKKMKKNQKKQSFCRRDLSQDDDWNSKTTVAKGLIN